MSVVEGVLKIIPAGLQMEFISASVGTYADTSVPGIRDSAPEFKVQALQYQNSWPLDSAYCGEGKCTSPLRMIAGSDELIRPKTDQETYIRYAQSELVDKSLAECSRHRCDLQELQKQSGLVLALVSHNRFLPDFLIAKRFISFQSVFKALESNHEELIELVDPDSKARAVIRITRID